MDNQSWNSQAANFSAVTVGRMALAQDKLFDGETQVKKLEDLPSEYQYGDISPLRLAEASDSNCLYTSADLLESNGLAMYKHGQILGKMYNRRNHHNYTRNPATGNEDTD